jgi:hypothetical protein
MYVLRYCSGVKCVNDQKLTKSLRVLLFTIIIIINYNFNIFIVASVGVHSILRPKKKTCYLSVRYVRA